MTGFDDFADDDLAPAELAARTAQVALSYFGRGLAVENKADGSPVTVADRAAEAAARAFVREHFPDDGFVGEEGGVERPDARRRWIVDPIDGTKSFILKTPLFGTLIALERDGQPVIGSIYFAIRDLMLIGSAETGTFLNGDRCRVSSQTDLSRATMIVTDPRDLLPDPANQLMIDLAREVRLVRGFGDCYGYYLVATGLADLMIEPRNLKYYDVAPMAPILAGAGGVFSSLGGDLDFSSGQGLAANPELHRQVVARAGQYHHR